jgi:hypothetical protein
MAETKKAMRAREKSKPTTIEKRASSPGRSNDVPRSLIKPAKLTPLTSVLSARRNIAPTTEIVKFVRELQALGYQTVEESFGVLQTATPELTSYLNVSSAEIDTLSESLSSSASALATSEEQEVINEACYELGVALEAIPISNVAPDVPLPVAAAGGGTAGPPSSPPTPSSSAPPAPPIPPGGAVVGGANLIAQMPPIRDQSRRSTCVAFAALAAYEHYLSRQATDVDLSEQFLYWNCKRNDGYPGRGTWLHIAFEMLRREGCCLEDTWPYQRTEIAGNEGQGPPPAGAQVQALSYRPLSYLNLAPNAVRDLKTVLDGGHCVSFAVPVYNSLMLNAQAKKTGNIPNPVPGEIPVGGHAMCLVGYQDAPAEAGLGGGRFLLRNSWGKAFGFASPFGAGYGTISYAYIARLGREAFALA